MPAITAVSCGDPAGIGPDVILTAFAGRAARGLAPFLVLGDPEQLAARARRLDLDVAVEDADPLSAEAVFERALPVLPLVGRLAERPGVPDPGNAAGIVEAIERGVLLMRDGLADALVTAPIAKKPLYEAGFRYPGHTEYLGHLAQSHFGAPATPVMMLAGPELRAVPVTVHVALAEVSRLLTTDRIIETCVIVARDLTARFGIEQPRLAVAGLNPHAGEAGAMGREDIDVVAPAIARLKGMGIDATGPLPADTMFHPAARARYDAAICMYHDQALIPAKALAFDDTVNVTLGLPFIRTSPDHGTAFDIAGTGQARADSFTAALKMAAAMSARR